MRKVNLNRGLVFRKLDLHVHTPSSSDFEDKSITPEAIVNQALSEGLDGIAITDHNSGEWIDRIKKAAENTKLTIFPGAEITCSGGLGGIHVIALFDPSKDTNHVSGLLSALGIPPDSQGNADVIVNELTLWKVIDTVQSSNWDGIVILAHINSNKGVFKEMQGQQRIKLIQYSKLIAVEGTDFQDETKKQNRKRAVDLLDGTDPDYKRKLAVYQASDNPNTIPDQHGHSIGGIGKRCAYFKMEQINLESLIQCFHDPEVRILQDFEYEPKSNPFIRQIKISSGFLDGQTVNFHTGLNSILGAKGTGKSLLIELLRFGLGQPPSVEDVQRDHITKLQNRLGEYGYVEISFVDKAGKEYEIKRTYNSYGVSPFEVSYDPSVVCPVLFLSQNEIIKIAEDEAMQLNFIDNFFDFQIYKTKIQFLEKELGGLDRQMAEGIRAIPEVEALITEIASLKMEIVKLDAELKNELFSNYNLARQKDQLFSLQEQYLNDLRGSSERLRQKTESSRLPELPPELKTDPVLKRNLDALTKARKGVEAQLVQVDNLLAGFSKNIEMEKTVWKQSFDEISKQYQTHIQQTGGDYKALAALREKNVRRLEDLTARLKIEQEKKDSTSEISTRRNKLLDELENIYSSYTTERQKKCEKFQESSGGRLELKILESSNVDEFRRGLLQLKQGSFLRENEIQTICENVKPRDFIRALLQYTTTIASKAKKPEERLLEVAKKSNMSLPKMTKLADFLTSAKEPEQLLALQYKAFPQDRPEIKFDIGDGHFEPLNAISIGQKSTALLIMALSDGDIPIVIDQPEDSLDIKSIWNDICQKLRGGKGNRQFIFTTHNSSVAVASDSDYFIVMDGNATKGKVVHSGSMDHLPIADEVLSYLEGGIETYRRKFKKYRGENRLIN